MRVLAVVFALIFLTALPVSLAAQEAAPAAPAPAVAAPPVGTPVVSPAPATPPVAAPPVEVAAPPAGVAAPPVVAPAAEVPAPVAVPEEAKKDEAPVVEPVTDEEAGKTLGTAVEMARLGWWTPFFGFVLLMVVWGLKKAKAIQWIPSKGRGWFAVGLGLAAALGVALASGIPAGEALTQGGASGGLAVVLWELVGQHVLSKKKS